MPDNSIHNNGIHNSTPSPNFSGFAAPKPTAVPAPLTTQQIADAVTGGVLEALREIGRAVSLTDDERNALEIHRLKRVALRRAAQAHVAKTAGIVERQTYNVTR